MEKVTRCFMSVLLLSAVLSSGLTEEKFVAEGGKLELGPNFSGEINTVTWKLNNELVAEWFKPINYLSYYDKFKDRTNLDKETGILKITKLTPADSGEYSVEINNMVRPERYNVKVIKEVPQPVVEVKPLVCNSAYKQCTLVCEGNTAGAEPVTYSWKMGEGDWVDGEKNRNIKPNETKSIKTFSCRIKNPISEKQSDTIENFFYSDEENVLHASNVGDIVVPVFGLLAVAGVVGLGFWKREYVNKKIQSVMMGHDKIATINDVETGKPLFNGTSDGPAGGPGASSTEGTDGESAHT